MSRYARSRPGDRVPRSFDTSYAGRLADDPRNSSSSLRQSGISLLLWWCLSAQPANTTILIVNTTLPQAKSGGIRATA